MFRAQLLRGAFALAGAAIFASTLLSPALAAPAGREPLPPQPTFAAKPDLNLPVADIETSSMGFSPYNGGTTYRFKIRNHGPDAVVVKVHADVGYKQTDSLAPKTIVYTNELKIWPNTSIEWPVWCPPAGAKYPCTGAVLYTDQIVGIDQHQDNNYPVIIQGTASQY